MAQSEPSIGGLPAGIAEAAAARFHLSGGQIAAFCERWNVVELALFGSVLRDDFGPDSDIDVLVRFRPGHHPSLFGLSRMVWDLEELVGRPVDLVERKAVERSRNYIRRRDILGSARTIYAAQEK